MNILYIGKHTLLHNDKYIDGKVAEVIRSIDVIKCEKEYATAQLGSKAKYINIEA